MNQKQNDRNILWYNLAFMAFSTVWGFGNVINGFSEYGGLKAIVSWLILFALYFIPYALMVGELGSAFKDEDGGVSSWIRRTINPGMAYMAGWTYWVVHMPYISQKPNASVIAASWAIFRDSRASQMNVQLLAVICLALFLFAVWIASRGVGVLKKLTSIAGSTMFIMSLLFIVMGKYIFRPDMSKLVHLDVSKLDKDGSLVLSRVQKVILAFLFLLVILLLAPNFMPKDFFLTRFLKGIGNTGIVILLVTVMAAIKVEGKALLNFKVMVDSGVTWGIVLLLAFVQPLSGAMAKPESGITSFLMMALDPIISGGTPLTFALFLGLAATLLTQVMNNGAVGVALMPIIYSYCQAANVSPELPLIMVVMGVHFAFLTPAASASAALLHGNEWSDSKAIWKTAPAVILMSYLVTAAITIIVGKAIF